MTMKKTKNKSIICGAYITQLKLIEFWKQKNLRVSDLSVRHFWTKLAGYNVGELEALWPSVDDPMDVDEPVDS
jgi:hypothetical protein